MMNTDYGQFAEALVFAHGPGAEAEAGRQALLCERLDARETAATWRQVQMVLREKSPKKPD